jgi:parallel beta-helix repeat protein
MKNIMKFISLLFVLSFISSLICPKTQFAHPIVSNESNEQLKIRSDIPISILNNTAFDFYDSGGNGTESNPWILENYVINASGYGTPAIYITNTNAYFILRNCTVLRTDSGKNSIYLQNLMFGNLDNNTVKNSGSAGIALQNSNNVTITNNIVNNSGTTGIYLANSDNNTLINNTAKYSIGYYGIHLTSGSDNNKLLNNTAAYNLNPSWGYGICLQSNSRFNNLTGNTANNNKYGFYIWDSDWNNLTRNTANSNSQSGIQLSISDRNNLNGNTANNNFYGITVGNSNYNNITWNTFLNCSQAIYVGGTSTGNIFYNNEISYAPSIVIKSPPLNAIFGTKTFDFELEINERDLNATWYSLDQGITNISVDLTGILNQTDFLKQVSGTINQTEWDKKGDGSVSLTFYANDTWGYESFKAITVIKDLTAPLVSVIAPTPYYFFRGKSPDFSVMINETHLDTLWYSLDGGITNTTFVSNGSIDQVIWDAALNGIVLDWRVGRKLMLLKKIFSSMIWIITIIGLKLLPNTGGVLALERKPPPISSKITYLMARVLGNVLK